MKIELPNISETNYFTNRTYKNEKGEVVGRVIMYRLKGEEEYHYYMKCQYCGHESQGKVVFKRRPFRLECEKCGKKTTIDKIKPKKK